MAPGTSRQCSRFRLGSNTSSLRAGAAGASGCIKAVVTQAANNSIHTLSGPTPEDIAQTQVIRRMAGLGESAAAKVPALPPVCCVLVLFAEAVAPVQRRPAVHTQGGTAAQQGDRAARGTFRQAWTSTPSSSSSCRGCCRDTTSPSRPGRPRRPPGRNSRYRSTTSKASHRCNSTPGGAGSSSSQAACASLGGIDAIVHAIGPAQLILRNVWPHALHETAPMLWAGRSPQRLRGAASAWP